MIIILLFINLIVSLTFIWASDIESADLNGFKIIVTKAIDPEKCKSRANPGDVLYVHYTGSIDESSQTGVKGKVFDSSLRRSDPLDFKLGAGSVIKGLEEGIANACVGEKRTLIIPPEYGYGSNGAGKIIPGGATLRFDVELVSINIRPKRRHLYFSGSDNVFKEIDLDNDKLLVLPEVAEYLAKHFKIGPHISVPKIFSAEDENNDGVITFDEFKGTKGVVEEQDL